MGIRRHRLRLVTALLAAVSIPLLLDYRALPFTLSVALLYIIAERRASAPVERQAAGLCPVCGYSLTGNVSGVCPECGTPTGRRRAGVKPPLLNYASPSIPPVPVSGVTPAVRVAAGVALVLLTVLLVLATAVMIGLRY